MSERYKLFGEHYLNTCRYTYKATSEEKTFWEWYNKKASY